MTEITAEFVQRRLAQAGERIDTELAAKLAAYLRLLEQWNRVYNLTGIRDAEALVARHLHESLALKPLLKGQRIADVGTGAGLPGIPLASAEPAREFTLIESRAKRARFLRHVVATLGLGNVIVEQSRAEDLPIAAPFDTVLARAVAPPEQLLEIVRPLTARGSILLLLTAEHLRAELALAAPDFECRELPAHESLQSTIVMLERG